ncbi:haloacid dehalogenase [Luteitalea sp. TBR-22]|uniref:Cof-type HAD-IIB family hydrolase n=1 Tax=Luteitalea sp. TBR-22 TaxID=2802971 RepID=UPI001AF3431D|nr:Cof-type HAD-IIB family hydrolase [Luteitalea sp. TBR-22]BCS33651.1 haloacid dehalogenase [Luteitalea sp. TBR-22]
MAARPPFRYRLAAIDIDDTLVGPDKQISPANREAIDRLRAAGCRVILASGREHHSMAIYQQRLGLDDYVVSSQGALVVHPSTGHQLWRRPVDAALAAQLLARGRAEGFDVLLATDEGFVAAPTSPWVVHNFAERDGTLRIEPRDLDEEVRHAPLKVLWFGETDAVHAWAATMAAELGADAEVVITTRHLLEFNAPDATKATGVAAVARHYGVAREDVLTFGDSHNDVPMLRWAGLGVAMPHALPEAHAAADLVAPDADPEDALAVAIDVLLAEHSPHPAGCL